ncbi:immunity 49 family protein [Nocardia sp. CA-107356]|uniref:immunity 49 family protein n=1 Tax=Nocardia sp. CA-107356 TaxID=3239972 RepID=UPI003D8F7CD4
MVRIVARHPIDESTVDGEQEALRSHLTTLLSLLPRASDKWGFALSTAENLLSVLALHDPSCRSAAAREAARLSENIAVGLFNVTGSYFAGNRDSVRLMIGDQEYQLPAEPNSWAYCYAWRTAFWWSLIARDAAAADRLSRYPVDQLSPKGMGRTDDFQYEWVRILQLAWSQNPGSAVDRVNALDTTTGLPGAEIRRIIGLLNKPVIAAFAKLAVGDHAGFNDELFQALTQHRKFFDTKKSRNDIGGFLSIPILGLSCWAHDLGVPIDVESEYIPKNFIEDPDWMRK